MAFIMVSLSWSSVLADDKWVACAAGIVRSISMHVAAAVATTAVATAAEYIGLTEPGKESENEPCVAATEST